MSNAFEENGMAEPIRPERLQIMLNPEELNAVDDFRFSTRMPSRAAAVRELLNRGLAAEGFEVAVAGMKSQSFGVLGRRKGDGRAAAGRESTGPRHDGAGAVDDGGGAARRR
jgi:hypothetical protein